MKVCAYGRHQRRIIVTGTHLFFKGTPMPIPFRMGDEVLINNTLHIIHEVNFSGTSFCYSTNRGAWYSHKQCVLKKEASISSIKQLKQALKNEYDDD